MTLHDVSISVLLALSSVLGVENIPQNMEKRGAWQISQLWQPTHDNIYQFRASSVKIVEACQKHPEATVEFPTIIHSAHLIFADGALVAKFGDPTFQTMRSFYGAPTLACSSIVNASLVTWEACSYSQYFARFKFFPRLKKEPPNAVFFQETINVIAAGFFLIMSVVNFIILWGKLSRGLAISFSLANLFFAGFFFWAVAGLFGVKVSMLSAHILADSSIFLGVSFFFNSLRLRGFTSGRLLAAFVGIKLISFIIFLLAQTGDTVQFATTLTFPLAMVLIFGSLKNLIKNFANRVSSASAFLQFLSLAFFMASIINDICFVTGITEFQPKLAFGAIAGLMFSSLSLNENIINAYVERDYLRQNLENEVERKTFELKAKTSALEKAMQDLKSTQAELVQSAKLASLGTLAAGIAHEINNSLNYVHGALQPLEKILSNPQKREATHNEKIMELIHVMKQGLHLTFEIMNSLRTYSGINQAQVKDVGLKQVVDSVLLILKSRLRDNIDVQLSIPSDLRIQGFLVGLNQLFMNLIVNSLDAMPKGGILKISAQYTPQGNGVEIVVSDTGEGIAKNIQDRIFEPFFTTKEVGQGTGLGLFIVKQEIDKHKGSIGVTSQPGTGTIVTIDLPLTLTMAVKESKAA